MAYGVTYAVCCMSIIAAACVLVLVACTFMGFCMMIYAGLQDVRDMLAEIDSFFPYEWTKIWRLYGIVYQCFHFQGPRMVAGTLHATMSACNDGSNTSS